MFSSTCVAKDGDDGFAFWAKDGAEPGRERPPLLRNKLRLMKARLGRARLGSRNGFALIREKDSIGAINSG